VSLDFERDGVAVNAGVVGIDILQKLADEFEGAGVRVGARPFALSPTIRQLVKQAFLQNEPQCGRARMCGRCGFWLSTRHPTPTGVCPLAPGSGDCSEKPCRSPGLRHLDDQERAASCGSASEPARKMFNLRLHIDDCDAANGALKVVPGWHRLGRLSDRQVREAADRDPAMICAVGAGGVLAMKALIIHASDSSSSPRRRRVLHVDYCWGALPKELEWALEVKLPISTHISP
jgi:hypothetical protein